MYHPVAMKLHVFAFQFFAVLHIFFSKTPNRNFILLRCHGCNAIPRPIFFPHHIGGLPTIRCCLCLCWHYLYFPCLSLSCFFYTPTREILEKCERQHCLYFGTHHSAMFDGDLNVMLFLCDIGPRRCIDDDLNVMPFLSDIGCLRKEAVVLVSILTNLLCFPPPTRMPFSSIFKGAYTSRIWCRLCGFGYGLQHI